MSQQTEIDGIKRQLELWVRKLNKLEESKILATDAAVLFKLEVEINAAREEIASLKQQLSQLEGIERPATVSIIKFPLHHQYTCNRIDQDEVFRQYVTNPSSIHKRLHFYN